MNEKSKETDLITVVIPVYNVEAFLEKCLDSVIQQTYKNLEIILVDDGSTDCSGKMCDEYAEKDSRIKVVHQKNKGLSGARNAGIEISKGEYITFIDSDDFVSEEFISYLYNLAVRKYADVSICSSIKFYEENETGLGHTVVEERVYNAQQALEDMLYRKNVTAYACGKLYRTTLFNEIRYPEKQLFEDLNTTYKIFDLAKVITWSSKKLYYYRQRNNSIVNSKFNKKKLSVIKAGLEIKDFVEKKYPEIYNAAVSKVFISAVDQYRKIPNSIDYREEKIFLKKIVKENSVCVLKDRKNKTLVRIIALVACFNIGVLRGICQGYTILTEKFHFRLNGPV